MAVPQNLLMEIAQLRAEISLARVKASRLQSAITELRSTAPGKTEELAAMKAQLGEKLSFIDDAVGELALFVDHFDVEPRQARPTRRRFVAGDTVLYRGRPYVLDNDENCAGEVCIDGCLYGFDFVELVEGR